MCMEPISTNLCAMLKPKEAIVSKQWVLVHPKGHVHGTDFKQSMRHA